MDKVAGEQDLLSSNIFEKYKLSYKPTLQLMPNPVNPCQRL